MSGLSALMKCELESLAEEQQGKFSEYQKQGLTLDAMTCLAKAEAYQDAASRMSFQGPAIPKDLRVRISAELQAEFQSVFEDMHLCLSLLRRRVWDVKSPEVAALAIWVEQTSLRAMQRMRKIMDVPF